VAGWLLLLCWSPGSSTGLCSHHAGASATARGAPRHGNCTVPDCRLLYDGISRQELATARMWNLQDRTASSCCRKGGLSCYCTTGSQQHAGNAETAAFRRALQCSVVSTGAEAAAAGGQRMAAALCKHSSTVSASAANTSTSSACQHVNRLAAAVVSPGSPFACVTGAAGCSRAVAGFVNSNAGMLLCILVCTRNFAAYFC
jgi:hypothetical protein